MLTIFINDEPVYETDREITLEENQLAFLDKIDSDLDRGIKIRGELITQPDIEQRLKFIAMNLIKALQQEDQAKIAMSCAYLINRKPDLMEVRASDQGDAVVIDLVVQINN